MSKISISFWIISYCETSAKSTVVIRGQELLLKVCIQLLFEPRFRKLFTSQSLVDLVVSKTLFIGLVDFNA